MSEEGLILYNNLGDPVIRNDVGIDVGAFLLSMVWQIQDIGQMVVIIPL